MIQGGLVSVKPQLVKPGPTNSYIHDDIINPPAGLALPTEL